jgi:hypothetical protein
MDAQFWSVNAGQLFIAVGMLGGFVLWFSRFEGRVRASTQGLKQLTDETEKTFSHQRGLLAEIVDRVNQIDREGTRKSQQAIASDEKLNEVTLKRIDKLEVIQFEQAPKIAEMAANMNWIVHHVQKNGAALNK